MKKTLLTIFVTLFAVTTFSQTASELDIMQKTFGLEKLQIVLAYVDPGNEYKETFLGIYEEYEEQRVELGKQRIGLLEEYAEEWDGMTNEQAGAWMSKVLDLSAKNDKLLRTYFNKVKKETSAITATQFYQVEMYIQTEIKHAILANIPFIEEK